MPASEQARDWLSLVLVDGLGPKRIAALEERFSSPSDWHDASDRVLREAGLSDKHIRQLRRPDEERLKHCLDWLAGEKRWLITRDDPLYPPLLRRIPDAPVALFVVGDPNVLVAPQIAIVGSRSATSGGLKHARSFAATLARNGFVISSGLAEGVDGMAHAGCLDAGGATIAVAGTGLDQVYPARHRDLARRIADSGALVSQFPPGIGPLRGNFPARNRIISGMSLGVLVVEAGLKSGSLITARLANEQGREVFAVPGSVHNPLSRGCHRLIRDGARLVETADEVAGELAPLARELASEIEHLLAPRPADFGAGLEESSGSPHMSDDPEYERLLDAVGFDPTPVDEIIECSQLTPAAVSSMLLMLELDGKVCAHPGGRYSRNA
ncbi:DNA-processing protein DprA [Wenzhouxiangella sp. EGI_FJ10305]|uniref:DNA-processing protein DprA n=1 Tax=Wenzhouxiangella sp. EGI_FJ10305 TaxID=3243768 RepID=UPI0035D71B37